MQRVGHAGCTPVLRVVSFHADDTNRSPTFDMDLTELLQDGQPISYSQAKAYFKSDPATRCALHCSASTCMLCFCPDLTSFWSGQPRNHVLQRNSVCACVVFVAD